MPSLVYTMVAMTLHAIFSDVHNQIRHLERVLAYLAARDVDSYLQLGDLGARPISLLDPFPVRHTFGNWEVSQLHKFPPERQPEVAAWPAHLAGSGWIASHASPVFPPECTDLAATQRYMARHRPRWMQLFPSLLHDENAVWAAFAGLGAQKRRVAFHGHTHVPRVFVKDRRVHEEPPESIVIEEGAKYFINAGSVGQPRDGDWRASYVIYDMPENKVVFRRIEYDLATAQQKILATDLPPGLADRLAEGR